MKFKRKIDILKNFFNFSTFILLSLFLENNSLMLKRVIMKNNTNVLTNNTTDEGGGKVYKFAYSPISKNNIYLIL